MTIVIVYRLDTNGYPTETYKGTGRNGRGKNIGTGEARKAAVGTVIGTVAGMVIGTAVDVVDTKVGVRWMMDWELISDSKVYFSLY